MKSSMLLTFTVFLGVVIMTIFGGMFLMGIAGEVSGEDMTGTEFEGVSSMMGSLFVLFQNILPLFVWLIVIAVIGMSLFFMFRYKR